MTDPTPGKETTSPVADLTYTEASRELDRIVQFFEQRDVDVDQLVGKLVRATAIIEELDERLRRTRMQVEQLVPKLTAVLRDTAGQGGEEERPASDQGDEPDPVDRKPVVARPDPSTARRQTKARVPDAPEPSTPTPADEPDGTQGLF